MKIQLLFIYGPLGGGGAERVLIDLLSNLDYTRYDVDLCLMVNGGVLLPEVPPQVNIISLWENYNLYYKVAYRESIWLRSNYLFKRILKKKLTKDYDVTISFLEGMPLKLHAMMGTNAKKITWVHCDLFNFHYTSSQFATNEELEAYNQMDVVVSVSKDTQKAFEKRFPACTTKAEVIYNPIDTAKISRLAEESQGVKKNGIFTIVTVGRLTDVKKIDRIIRVASLLKKESIEIYFQIIGDGELKKDLLALRQELDVEDRVDFLGFIKNPYSYIKNADMMLMSSDYEGFGLVICEAMCLGIPVISTKNVGSVEIIGNDEFGLLCDFDDESIYKAVKKMMDDSDLRRKYSTAGLKRAGDFSVAHTVLAFDKLIDS